MRKIENSQWNWPSVHNVQLLASPVQLIPFLWTKRDKIFSTSFNNNRTFSSSSVSLHQELVRNRHSLTAIVYNTDSIESVVTTVCRLYSVKCESKSAPQCYCDSSIQSHGYLIIRRSQAHWSLRTDLLTNKSVIVFLSEQFCEPFRVWNKLKEVERSLIKHSRLLYGQFTGNYFRPSSNFEQLWTTLNFGIVPWNFDKTLNWNFSENSTNFAGQRGRSAIWMEAENRSNMKIWAALRNYTQSKVSMGVPWCLNGLPLESLELSFWMGLDA